MMDDPIHSYELHPWHSVSLYAQRFVQKGLHLPFSLAGASLRLSTSQSPLSCSGSSGYLPGSVSPCSRMVPSSPICVYTQASFPLVHPGFTDSPAFRYTPFDLDTSLRLGSVPTRTLLDDSRIPVHSCQSAAVGPGSALPNIIERTRW